MPARLTPQVTCIRRFGSTTEPAGYATKPLTRREADELINQCVLVGKYFTCQQVVNGEVGALLVIVPAGKTGHYYTQNVGLDGRATGRGEMQIDGDRSTYNTIWNQGGTSTYYKTIHTFTGGDRIHFEQLESKNNKDWKTTNSVTKSGSAELQEDS